MKMKMKMKMKTVEQRYPDGIVGSGSSLPVGTFVCTSGITGATFESATLRYYCINIDIDTSVNNYETRIIPSLVLT